MEVWVTPHKSNEVVSLWAGIELNWTDLHSMNPRQINTLDVEQIRKILHTLVAGTIQLIKLSLSLFIHIKVVFYRVESVCVCVYIYI